MKDNKVLKITLTAVMAALAYVVFTFLQIKVTLPGGSASSFHLGNAVCCLAALLLGGVYGGLAGAIGMTIGDVFDPIYVIYAPKTFILKFCIGLITGIVAHKFGKISVMGDKKYVLKWSIIACAAGMLFNFIADPLLGYFYNVLILGKATAQLALGLNVITTGVNAVISVIVAVVVYMAMRKGLKRSNLFFAVDGELFHKKRMDKKVLLINDLPSYGKVALSAAMPILIHKGYELYNMPSVLISNTLDYGRHTMLDTTQFMQDTVNVWEELGFRYDAVSVGFIANNEQAKWLYDFCSKQQAKGTEIFLDPIMGDNGKLYNSVTDEKVASEKELVKVSDYVVPNYTEACYLTGTAHCMEGVSEEELKVLIDRLKDAGAKSVVITSAPLKKADGSVKKCVSGYDAKKDEYFTVTFEEIPVKFNGTGDTFLAIMMSYVLGGKSLKDSAAKAAKGVSSLIAKNIRYAGSYNGLPIEAALDVL